MNTTIKQSVVWGVLATIVMSIFMVTATLTGVSPMPAPIPVALVKTFLGPMPKPALIFLGIIAHLVYGGVAGGILGQIFKERINLWIGLGWGVLLWLLMQVIFLPILGWGAFGSAITPKIAVATLILHLIYGGTLGWGLQWRLQSNPMVS